MKSIKEQLILHEGLELKPYKCTANKWTIGVGRNLEGKGLDEEELKYLLHNNSDTSFNTSTMLLERSRDISKGITREEVLYLLERDIEGVEGTLERYTWYNELDEIRKKIIIDMVFNLGISGFLSFKNTIQAIKDKDYNLAAKEMVNSRWYRQVGTRSKRLVEMMKSGEDYTK